MDGLKGLTLTGIEDLGKIEDLLNMVKEYVDAGNCGCDGLSMFADNETDVEWVNGTFVKKGETGYYLFMPECHTVKTEFRRKCEELLGCQGDL